ncbi:hypothetical protein Lepto7375DRAFT_0012 [Leptolyngbya sp. PCC 7375]|nr:hypothetical protein Lepto7375DRAFT_0012 [Leptolyngbya sp. PCC 7375]
MYTPEELLEAAKSVRQFLPQMLDQQKAQKLDRQLSLLIGQYQAGESSDEDIAELLESDETISTWIEKYLSAKIFQDRGSMHGIWENLPGLPIVSAPRYICPYDDYIWHHIDGSDPIPHCPTHDCPLRRDEP